MLYVIVTGNACGFVNVIFGEEEPWHTAVAPLIDAVGNPKTFRVAAFEVALLPPLQFVT
jgi:hypothetical protein